jgi:hypothetical protein
MVLIICVIRFYLRAERSVQQSAVIGQPEEDESRAEAPGRTEAPATFVRVVRVFRGSTGRVIGISPLVIPLYPRVLNRRPALCLLPCPFCLH